MSSMKIVQNVKSGAAVGSSSSQWASKSKDIFMPDDSRFSPLDFCNFVPWLCKQWQILDEVHVVTQTIESYVALDKKKIVKKKKTSLVASDSNIGSSRHYSDHHNLPEDFFPIKAYFTESGSLFEVALVNFSYKMDPRIIKIFINCLPFNKSITKISILKAYVTSTIINLIAEGLPKSFLTEICFDGSYIAGNEYYILLDKKSQLKYLSLKRCGIDDKVVEEIAIRLSRKGPSADMLQILDLTSNVITDEGAKVLGEMLRTNRQLVHLGLAGNRITDVGATHILGVLMEFLVTGKEMIETREQKFKYMKRWKEVYDMCLQQVSEKAPAKNDSKRTAGRKISQKPILLTAAEKCVLATNMVESILGKFDDAFARHNVTVKDSGVLSQGNLKLAYLNLAYNDLQFPSLIILLNVLKYQSIVVRPPNTGLVRVILDGNRIPFESSEMNLVDSYLAKSLPEDSLHTKLRKKSKLLHKR